jgi:hypothetical protein
MNYRETLIQQANLTPNIFWDISDITQLSNQALLERVLNYGNLEQLAALVRDRDSFREVYDSIRNKQRSNLTPLVINYIDLFLERYA